MTRTVSSPASAVGGRAGLAAVMDDPFGRSGQRGAAPDASLAGRGWTSTGPSGNRSVLVTVPGARACTLAAGLERVAAAAGGGGVRVLDRKAAAYQVFLVVDLGPFQVPHAHGVDDDLDAVLLEDLVAVR